MRLEQIKGPPGTGKTTTISQEALKEVANVGKDNVLVASLTRAAAREAARVVDLPDKQIGTWHAFAYRALDFPELAESHKNNWNENFPAYQLTDKGRSGDALSFSSDGWGTGDRLLLEYSAMRAQNRSRPWPGRVETFAQRWEDWKKSCNYLDFHDLIDLAIENTTCAPGNPEVIFCDEEQDLSYAEAQLVAHWAASVRRLVLVGDSHQSIFGWRGSDPVKVQGLWNSIPADMRMRRVLEHSYRIPAAVHKVAMTQMAKCAPLSPVQYYPRNADGSVHRGGPFSNGEGLVRNMELHLKEGKTVMLLATCGYLLEPVIRSLGMAGIPWHNPWRVTNGRWNPLQVTRGVGFRERCCAFTRPSRALWGENAQFWTVADLKAWTQPLPAKDVFKPGMKTHISRLKSSMTDVELAEGIPQWFNDTALAHILAFDLDWYLGCIPDTKTRTSFKLVKSIATRRGAAALVQEPQVIVGTIHSLKGSEADVVYLCPDLSLAAVQAASQNSMLQAEIQRVFYVGVTRARETLILCEPSSGLHVRI